MPDWRRELEERLPGLNSEIANELEQHLEDRYAELRGEGETHESAYRKAIHQELNGCERISIEYRGGTMFGNIGQDFRYAFRMVRRNAAFALIAMLTLAIGIGATTAIFTVVNSVVMRPLPFPNSDRLVRLREVTPEANTFSASHPTFLDWKQQNRSFAAIAAYSSASFNVAADGGVERVSGMQVSDEFLAVAGILPAQGRNFLPEEDRKGGNNRVAILSYSFWKNHFNGDPGIVGKQIILNENSYDVVGLLPESFPWTAGRPDVLVPLVPDPGRNRQDHRLLVIARMKDGTTVAQAQSDMSGLAKQIGAQFPASNKDWGVDVQSFYDWFVPQQTRTSMWVFAAAAAFVLLIACGNVANLLLARSSERHKEISIRLALGSGGYRVMRQLLIEALLIALIGGSLGVVLAIAGTGALKKMDAGVLPRLEEVSVDGRVLAFSLAVSLLTGVIFGLAPAFQASRSDLNESLKEGGRGGSSGLRRQRLRNALVVVEVALSIALLASAGLLMRSFWTLQNVNVGFEPANLLTMRLNLPASRYSERAQSTAFYQRLLDQLQALPGVQAAAISSNVPMGGGNTGMSITQPEKAETAVKPLPTDWRIVSTGYFKTLNIPVRGRTFNDGDRIGGSPVVIISEEMARRYWPGQDVIGKSFLWYSDTSNVANTIVGVAGDVQNISLERDPRPVTYMALAPNSGWNPMIVSLRTTGDSAAIVSAVRSVMKGLDSNIPVYDVQTAQELVDLSLGDRRFRMVLIGCFAAIALLLSCVGLFSVMAYLVSQRTHEIGIRLSLGARPADVFRLVVGKGMILAALGSAIGLGGAFFLARWLKDLLFRIQPTDPLSFGGAVILLLLVSLLACYIPARRATRVDPLTALRHE